MKILRRTASPRLSPRRELIHRIRHLSNDKIEILLNTVKSLEAKSTKTMTELEHDMKTGEYKKWTTADYLAWDEDFTKLTPEEEIELEKGRKQIAEGDVISFEQLCREEGL